MVLRNLGFKCYVLVSSDYDFMKSIVWNFARSKLRLYQGMHISIRRFYDAIAGEEKCPVSKEEALMVIETMDEI